MTLGTHVAPLTDSADIIAALSDMLIEVVANGGSVSFMHPLKRDVAENFWKDSRSRLEESLIQILLRHCREIWLASGAGAKSGRQAQSLIGSMHCQ